MIVDIRWEDVYARIRPRIRNELDLEPNIQEADVIEVVIEVRWEHERFVARYFLDKRNEDLIPWTLEAAIANIDAMMLRHGYPPYVIRSE